MISVIDPGAMCNRYCDINRRNLGGVTVTLFRHPSEAPSYNSERARAVFPAGTKKDGLGRTTAERRMDLAAGPGAPAASLRTFLDRRYPEMVAPVAFTFTAGF